LLLSLREPRSMASVLLSALDGEALAKPPKPDRQRTCPRISPVWCAHDPGAAVALEAILPPAQQGVAADNRQARPSASPWRLPQNAATLIWNDVASSF
jgi:hypothetical protein